MKKIILFSLGISLVLSACGKFRYDKDQSAEVNRKVESAFDEMTNISDQAITGNMVYYKNGGVIVTHPGDKPVQLKTACNVIITIDTTGSVKTVTVDYGSSNCDCNDGKTRRGKIVTTFTGPYHAQGTIITHTPVDYYVNDIKIEGTKTVENMGLNTTGQPYFNVQIDGVATLTTGETMTYTSTRVRTWTAGFNTLLNRFDDEYDITGTASGVFSSGGSYTANITAPVHIKVGCGFPVSGTVEITPQSHPVRVLDYGTGTCDATFTVTVSGHTYTFN
ncbi:MAG: hypothetical protein RLZZ30_1103 [Bacteroidota bacterium]|jgi:hypothetical protein